MTDHGIYEKDKFILNITGVNKMTDKLRKASTMEEAVSVLMPEPLKPEEMAEFYIQTDEVRDENCPATEEIKLKLRREPPCKILFAGHRGSGKSTELVRLEQEIKDEYYVIKFSVREHLDVFNLEYSDLILLMIERIFRKAGEDGYIKNEKLMEAIYEWFTIITRTKTEEQGSEAQAEVGVGVPEFLSKIYGIMARVTSMIKLSASDRTEIRQEVHLRILQLKTNCDAIINEINNKLSPTGKKLLVIVEDLDKVELNKLNEIFFQHSGILSEIGTRIIYTVPIFLTNSNKRKILDGRFSIVTLPMIKICEMDGGVYGEGRERLRRIVWSRIEKDILEEDLLNEAIGKTGGVIRDLFKTLDIAASSALVKKMDRIEEGQLKYGLNRVKRDYKSSIVGEKELKVETADLYRELTEIYINKKKELPFDDKLMILLNSQALIEYNGVQWYGIHPLVVELLYDFGYMK